MSKRVPTRTSSSFQRFRLWCLERGVDCIAAPALDIIAYLDDTVVAYGIERMLDEQRAVRRTYRLIFGLHNAADSARVAEFVASAIEPEGTRIDVVRSSDAPTSLCFPKR